MRFTHVRMIAAIGNSGQLGLDDRLPWVDPADLAHFKTLTMGGIVIVGSSTAKTLPTLPGRDVRVWQRRDDPEQYAITHEHRTIWIAGGAKIYEIWRPFWSMSIITHIDYDGPADRWLPFIHEKPSGMARRWRRGIEQQ